MLDLWSNDKHVGVSHDTGGIITQQSARYEH